MTSIVPDAEVLEDLVYAARYGELEELQMFVDSTGHATREQNIDFLCSATDENRNTALHMSCANGHLEVIRYLLDLKAPPQFLQNSSGNTALHWAAQNGQIDALKLLQPFLTPDVVLLHNLAGQDCIALAEERASNEKALECAGFLSNLVPETEEEKKDSQKEQQSSTEDVVNEPDEDSSKIKGDEAKATNGIETLDLKDSA